MIRTDLIAPLGVLLRRHASERGGKIAFEDARASVTYAELEARTARLAGYLQAGTMEGGSMEASPRIAILLPNSVDWVVACVAIVRAGCIAVPISHDATEAEIRYRLEDAACSVLFVSEQHLALATRLRAALPRLRTLIATTADVPADVLPLSALLARCSGNAPRDPADIDATAFVVYTSGTTGRAKGVMLTQRSMLWVTAACWVLVAGLREDDVVLSPLPLFHSYALNLSVISILAVGATEHLLERFSTQDVLARLQTGRFTMMPGVPTMFHYLLEGARAWEGRSFPGVRCFLSAGAILPATLNREFEARFDIELLDGYGITETSTMVTLNWPGDGRVMGSCGLPLTGLAVRIVDFEGRDVATGGEGELIVRGPNLMQGYLDKPSETAAALRDGWYHTGDLARSDRNGFLTITGRLKELIIRGGQNIAPGEVEEAVLSHADVLDCAVVGVAHKHLGEVPVVFVMARAGSTFDADAVIRHCETLLSAYKVPHAVHLVDAIPRTGSGKIMRFKLRERLAAGA
jgi:acyl-CoA synthetase (AMP-forming)/AMP-acid ligase II